MKNSAAINTGAVLVLAAALGWLYFFLHPFPPSIEARPHQEVGEVLAAEAVKWMESGGRLIVIARDSETFEVPAGEAQLEGLLQAVKKAGKAPSVIRRIKLDPLRILAVPPGDFFDLLRQGRENDVIVSLLGPPVLDPEQLTKLPARRPRVLAACLGSTTSPASLRRLFDLGLIQAAVVPRNPSGTAGTKFEQVFHLITAANLGELSGTAKLAD